MIEGPRFKPNYSPITLYHQSSYFYPPLYGFHIGVRCPAHHHVAGDASTSSPDTGGKDNTPTDWSCQVESEGDPERVTQRLPCGKNAQRPDKPLGPPLQCHALCGRHGGCQEQRCPEEIRHTYKAQTHPPKPYCPMPCLALPCLGEARRACENRLQPTKARSH